MRTVTLPNQCGMGDGYFVGTNRFERGGNIVPAKEPSPETLFAGGDGSFVRSFSYSSDCHIRLAK